MQTSILRLSFLLLAILSTGCDRAGIHPLGRLRDGLVPCEIDALGRFDTTSTWVRSTDEGTEIILLGRSDPTTAVPNGSAACFGLGFVAHDSSTTFAFGSYTLDETGVGTTTRVVEYTFVFQPERSILGRDGSTRADLPTPIVETLTITRDGSQLVLDLGGEPRLMTSLAELIDSLDPTTQEGAEDIFRVYNLPLFTSQARLLGFGSGAMTQYVGPEAPFAATIRNRFTVSVKALLTPHTDITYYQFEDLTGIVVDGVQRTLVNTKGNGPMEGTLNFVMRGETNVRIRGHVDYGSLEIADGLAAGGTYVLTIDGVAAEYTISHALATDVDLRNVLPVELP